MKDKTNAMYQELIGEILEFKPSRRHRLVFAKDGGKRARISQQMLNNDAFLNSSIYEKIKTCTKFLDVIPEITMNDRIVAIFRGLNEIPACPICGKQCRLMKWQRSIISKPLFSEFCSQSCQAVFASKSRGETTDFTRKLMHDSAVKSKSRLLDGFKHLIEEMNDNSLAQRKDDVITFCNSHVASNNGISAIDLEMNRNILIEILRLTPFIAIPSVENIHSRTDFCFNERMYCIANEISDTVKCQFCNQNSVKFINMKRGYSDVCSSVLCLSDKVRKVKGLQTSKDIISMIEKDGQYVVLHFPENIETDYLVVKCNKCGTVSKRKLFCGRAQMLDNLQLCDMCDKYVSCEERELRVMLQDLVGVNNMRFQDRELISPFELDIVIDSHKIAIEYDGFYWHNQHVVKKQYHQVKTMKCKTAGYDLIHIFSDELLMKKEVILNEFKRALNIEQKIIYASRCSIKAIDEAEFFLFASKNCILSQNKTWSDYYALIFENETVAAVAVKRSKSQTIDIEMSLLIEKAGIIVDGAVDELTAYFANAFFAKSVMLTVNNRWPMFSRKYLDAGFSIQRIVKYAPNFFSIKTNGAQHLSLRQFKELMKDELPKYGDVFECAAANKYEVIYDSGALVLSKQIVV